MASHLWRVMSGQSAPSGQSASPTQRDLAEAFADALLAYGDWIAGQPEREISIGGTKFSMTAVCGLFDQFADELPQHVFDKLRSYMELPSHSDLIVSLPRIVHTQPELGVSAD